MKTLFFALCFCSFIWATSTHFETLNYWENHLHGQNTMRAFSTHDSCKLCWHSNEHSAVQEFIAFRPLLGFEYRKLDTYQDKVQAWDGGVFLYGAKGNLEFWLDARIFTQSHEQDAHYSYDGDFIEAQDENLAAELSYVSYARYYAQLEYHGSFGTLGYQRQPITWGPGVYNSLVLNSKGVPYSSYYYEASLGPVRVVSLFGMLSLQATGHPLNVPGMNWEEKKRYIYAHRYEWNVTNWLLLGMSEQMIVYDDLVPAAHVPIVPLFMEKGQVMEPKNNGNIAVDFSSRYKQFNLYGEFLVDDLQDPKGIFNDYWSNRWAAMLGLKGDWEHKGHKTGFLLEYARVEPWVYTHYTVKTAQAAHKDIPLGHFAGPNSRNITVSTYWKPHSYFWIGFKADWLYKGTSRGSSILDPIREQGLPKPESKEFLDGGVPVVWSMQPWVRYEYKRLVIEMFGALKHDTAGEDHFLDWVSRIGFML
jgi:hypothetical protein